MSSIHISLLGLVLLAAAVTPVSAVALFQFNVSHLENFDTLAIATDSVMPAGWQFTETGTSANTSYGAGTGSSSTGNTYSFGATGSTERALGSVRTSGVAATYGTLVSNDTGSTIDELTIQYTGEQWRLAALARVDRLDFSYSFDATSISTGLWFDLDELDFTGPVTAGVLGALDGNAAENQLMMSHTITGLNLVSGTSVWLRWVDLDAAGSDDGLAIDNFTIVAERTPVEPQNVPENLPMAVIAPVLGGLLLMGNRRRLVAVT